MASWCSSRKVDIQLPGKGDSNSHGARPVYSNNRTSRLLKKNPLSAGAPGLSKKHCNKMDQHTHGKHTTWQHGPQTSHAGTAHYLEKPCTLSFHRMYSLISFRKSIPLKNHQVIVYYQYLKISSWRFCGEDDFLKLINRYIVSDKVATTPHSSRGAQPRLMWPTRTLSKVQGSGFRV